MERSEELQLLSSQIKSLSAAEYAAGNIFIPQEFFRMEEFTDGCLERIAKQADTNIDLKRDAMIYLFHAYRLGGSVIVSDLLKKAIGELQIPERREQAQRIARLRLLGKDFVATTSIGGVTLSDFIHDKSLSLTQRFGFLVDIRALAISNPPDEHREFNQDLYDKFPLMTDDAIIDTATAITVVSEHIKPSFIERQARIARPLKAKQIYQAIKLTQVAADSTQNHAYKTLLDPQSQDFAELSFKVDSYLASPSDLKRGALIWEILFSKTPAEISRFYRQARKFIFQNIEPSFYERLTSTVEEYVEDATTSGLLTRADMPAILRDHQQDIEIPERVFEALRRHAVAIPQLGHFNINPPEEEYSNANLRPADKVTIRFGHSPYKFDLIFIYTGDEPLALATRFDIRKLNGAYKDSLDWNFIADSADPDMVRAKAAVLKMTLQILEQLSSYILSSKSAPKSQVSSCTQEPVDRKGDRQQRMLEYAQNNELRGNRNHEVPDEEKPLKPNWMTELETKETKGARISYEIELPEEDELERMLSGFSSVDRQIILDDIQRLNSESQKGYGLNRLSQLTSARDSEGNPLFRYDIRTTTPKGVRVRLVEVLSEKGRRVFKALHIKNRSKAYQDL